jgi:hypothetical protein
LKRGSSPGIRRGTSALNLPSFPIIKRPSPSGHPKIQVTIIVLPEALQLKSRLYGEKYSNLDDSIVFLNPIEGFFSPSSGHIMLLDEYGMKCRE